MSYLIEGPFELMIHGGKSVVEESKRNGVMMSLECNRDEAMRAKELAQLKFQENDIKGAKKFALKAQNLHPQLDGISQMLMTLDVYLSAQDHKIHGESNWYRVLGVAPLSDDEAIRKQFRKLALLLHPDKNRSVGAEGAFQLVSQAWSFLSDKSQRKAYDRRSGLAFQQRNQMSNGDPPPPPTTTARNGSYNFAKNTATHSSVSKNCSSKRDGISKHSDSKHRTTKGDAGKRDAIPKFCSDKDQITKGNPSSRDVSSGHHSSRKERRTFWTVCHRCRMQYEYLIMYQNHHLLCPNCQVVYFAVEIEPPSSRNSKTFSDSSNSKKWQNANHRVSNAAENSSYTPGGGTSGSNCNNDSNVHWTPFSTSTGSASAVQAAKMVKQAYEKVKKERQKAQAATRKEEAPRRKYLSSKRTMNHVSFEHSDTSKRLKSGQCCGTYKENVKHNICETGNSSQKNMDGQCHNDTKQLLMENGRRGILGKLNDHNSATTMKNQSGKEVHVNIKDNKTADLENITSEHHARELGETKSQIPWNTLNSCTLRSYGRELGEEAFLNVPDSDFHDFDKDRMARCFKDNQVWAVYDDCDGMPRHYAMVHSVLSLNPFKVKLSWLYSITSSGLAFFNWYVNGFSKTCGEFKIGRLELCTSLECFSHKVQCLTCSQENICIFPRKREIWALYRNWSSKWSELTEDEVVHKYDLVEVLECYDEKSGTIVIPLVKVCGFKSVFHRHSSPDEIRRIPVEEMSRFSHKVPSHLLTDQGPKSPNGCYELDPAAIPLEILQVLSENREHESFDASKDIELVKKVDC